MRPREPHRESHHISRSGWLRAAVLGSNDAIVSTSSLMIGVAASAAERATIIVAGVSADELNIDRQTLARPLQAAWISAASFAVFAAVPVLALLIAPATLRIPTVAAISLTALASLGALGAHLGGALRLRAAVRVTIGGVIAMGISAGVGHLFGVAVG